MILLAIIAIGASYTGLDDGRDFADTMAEITRRVLWFKVVLTATRPDRLLES